MTDCDEHLAVDGKNKEREEDRAGVDYILLEDTQEVDHYIRTVPVVLADLQNEEAVVDMMAEGLVGID